MRSKKKKRTTSDPAPPPSERTRYFARMVVTPTDLTRDQEYHIKQRQYWVRRLHGWGVIAGLEPEMASPEKQKTFGGDGGILIAVSAGEALDHQGREIMLTREALVNIALVDGEGHCIIVKGDGANPAAPGTSLRPLDGGPYLFVVRYKQQRTRFVPSPSGMNADGSEASEASLYRDFHAFSLVPVGEDAAAAASAAAADGAVVLGTIQKINEKVMTVDCDHLAEFPIDPIDVSDDSADELVRALADGHLDRAEIHLDRWKRDIKRGLHRLLDSSGLVKLSEIGPRGELRKLAAKYLTLSDEDPIESERLREFFVRAESPFEPHHPLSVLCVSRLSYEEFKKRVGFSFRPNEMISDVALRHAHRAASLVTAVAPQWPAPRFDGLIS